MTNDRFADLDSATVLKQQQLLEPLRVQQQHELLASGAAHRIIASMAISNMQAEKDPVTEGTWLYPMRRTAERRSAMQNNVLRADLRMAPADLSLRASPDPLRSVFSGPENYVLYMGRSDAIGRGTSIRMGLGYVAGVSLTAEVAESAKLQRLLPMPGVQVEDLQLIKSQLADLAAFVAEHEIDIIDTVTLEEGYGEPLSW